MREQQMQLAGKVAIVTGSSRGIGAEIAHLFAREGASVVVNYAISRAEAEKVVREIRRESGTALVIGADVADRQQVNAMIAKTIRRFGHLDILVNNAAQFCVKPAEEMTEEDWDRVLDTNLKGAFLCSLAAGKQMIQQGGGKIINIGTAGVRTGTDLRLAYITSKGGLETFTKMLGIEWAKYNVLVNGIAPGHIHTRASDEKRARLGVTTAQMDALIPIGRMGTEAEIAQVALFLASDACSYMVGQTLYVDGGLTSRQEEVKRPGGVA